MNIFNYETPDWTLLERAVTAAGLPQTEISNWMWMCENPAGVHQYKHCNTRKYAILSANQPLDEAAAKVNAARPSDLLDGWSLPYAAVLPFPEVKK